MISENTCAPISGRCHSVVDSQVARLGHLLGAALLAFAVQSAYCQVDLNSFSDQNSPAQRLVSKNQLLTPAKAQKALNRAYKHFSQRRFESAQQDVRQALNICPHCSWALTFQGVLNLQDENYPEAVRSFQRAIDEDPAAGSAYLGMGTVFNSQARFREALVEIDRAVPFLPDSWLLSFECAWAHLGVGESVAGLREISHAEGLAGTDPTELSGVAYLHGVAELQLKHYDGAKKFLEDAIKHEPEGVYARLAKERIDRMAPHLGEPNDKTGVVNESAVGSTNGVNGRPE